MGGMVPSATSVFGRQGSQSVANQVMQSPSLNATPSPVDPLQMPADDIAKNYARLLAAAYELRKLEKDALSLLELDRVIRFGESMLSSLVGRDVSLGAPAATPTPPQMPGAAPPQAAGSPPGMPPQMAMAGMGSPPASGGMSA